MNKRVLILSAKVGAGHARAADAVLAALRRRHAGIQAVHLDALEYCNPIFRRVFMFVYGAMAQRLPSVWRHVYERTEFAPIGGRLARMNAGIDSFNSGALVKEVQRFNPNLVICTHYLPAEVLAARKRKGKLNARLAVVLTDYAVHTMWIQHGADDYFVATDEMSYSLRRKLHPDDSAAIHVTGIPIFNEFSHHWLEKARLREYLGLDPKRPAVLVASGGLAWGRLDTLVQALATEYPQVQFLVVAGHNKMLYERLKRMQETHRAGTIVPFGFVSNMHELMAASNFGISKPGGLSSSEYMAMNLPMIIIDPIPGQEERNCEFLLQHGVALRARSIENLLFTVSQLLSDEALLTRIKSSCARIARPDAAENLVRMLTPDAEFTPRIETQENILRPVLTPAR